MENSSASIHFSFRPLDWFMIDRIFENESTFEDMGLDEIRKVQLALNVLPQNSSLLKVVAQKARKED